jgi:hypothetical protein
MRGYLQRLSSSVLNPGGTIHPILKPIYSSVVQAIPERFAEEEIAPVQGWPERTIQPSEPTHSVAQPTLAALIPKSVHEGAEPPAAISEITPAERPAPPRRAESKIEPGTIPQERPPFMPLVQKTQRKPVRDNLREPIPFSDRVVDARQIAPVSAQLQPESTSLQDLQPITDLPEAPRTATASVDPTPDRNVLPAAAHLKRTATTAPKAKEESPRIVLKDRSIPPVIQATQQQPQSSSREISGEPISRARREERRPAFEGWKQPEREPDEIQIHIGQIEVTAVPPPQAPPVARPERKTVSLDDYLKSRHGRM